MVYCTDAVDTVYGAINTTQLQEIVDAIDEKIQYKRDTMVSEIQKRVEQVVSTIEEMSRQTEAIFSGVTKDDMKTLMSAVTKSGLDEQKIVKAYMEQKNAALADADTDAPSADDTPVKAGNAS